MVLPLSVPVSSASFYWKFEPVELAESSGIGTSIAVNSSDSPHLAYTYAAPAGRFVKYAYRTGSEWIRESFDSEAYSFPSLKLDSLDRPHIVYSDIDRHLRYAYRDGVIWKIEVVDPDEESGITPSLAIDSLDRPHISYYKRGYDRDLRYAHWNGVDWNISTIDTLGNVGAYSSIALDSLDRPHIIYEYNDPHSLKYAHWNGTEWVIENLTSFGVAYGPSLVLDSLDRPHLSYMEYDGSTGHVKYAKWTGMAWEIRTVSPGPNRLREVFLALDSSDFPHVAYANESIGGHGIAYSRWTGVKWETEAVKLGGALHVPALALDSKDRPHICFSGSYHDAYVTYAGTTSEPLPDPSVSSSDISFHPSGPVLLGTTVAVNATIHNIGYSDASDVLVRLYDVTPPSSKIGDDVVISSIPVGGSNHTHVLWNPYTSGLRRVCVYVDPFDDIEEADEANNIACQTIYVYVLPDIVAIRVASEPTGPVPVGIGVTLEGNLSNEGSEDASNFEVTFFADDNHDRIIQAGEALYTEIVPYLGIEDNISINYSFIPLIGGSFDVCLMGDPPGTVEESNESNNIICMNLTVITPVYPGPPTNLDAELDGGNLSDVLLTWDLSPDDGNSSNPVIGYEVFRGTSYERRGASYTLCGSVANSTAQYSDTGAGSGNPNNYFYVVCGVNDIGVSSCTSNQAGKFTRPLGQGPELISIPLIQADESIETVLQTVEYDRAWSYDSSSREWNWYMTGKGYRRGLWNMNHTMGVWVNVTKHSNQTVAGIVPAPTTIHLHEGWNLVSFPSFNSSYTVYDLKMDTGAVRVEGYDLTSLYHLRVLGDVEVLQAGLGYWVRVGTVTDWIVQVS